MTWAWDSPNFLCKLDEGVCATGRCKNKRLIFSESFLQSTQQLGKRQVFKNFNCIQSFVFTLSRAINHFKKNWLCLELDFSVLMHNDQKLVR